MWGEGEGRSSPLGRLCHRLRGWSEATAMGHMGYRL